MNRHKHADLIHAWAEGTEIETFYEGSWTLCSPPPWYEDMEYRIKPKELDEYDITPKRVIYRGSKHLTNKEIASLIR